jgi:hypothetical protein
MQVPQQCPFVLPVKVVMTEFKALGNDEAQGKGIGPFFFYGA